MSERKELAARLRATAREFLVGMGTPHADVLRAADLLDPPARGRTVRVRIAVAVGAKGEWYALSGDGWSDADRVEAARDGSLVDDTSIVWIECDVPLPEETTVEGEVQP